MSTTAQTAKLILPGGKETTLPERAVDIRALRKETGYITMDPGYVNTGACESAITFIDGEKGILRYRGYPSRNSPRTPSSSRWPTC
jgi:citrate synthase